MNILNLVRSDLRQFSGYLSARKQNSAGETWLNANESPMQHEFDSQQLNRYPEPQPLRLKNALCAYYQVNESQLLITRGSDEGIDCLVRALCEPGKDSIAVQTPTFGMYAVCAKLHACTVIDSPLERSVSGFGWNVEKLISDVISNHCKIVFLCSPSNPTGQTLPVSNLLKIVSALHYHCVLVVDEAYIEFSEQQSAIELLSKYSNLVILRTLSKAHALAGARIGCVIANQELIAVLKTCQAPYPISKPSAEIALNAMCEKQLVKTRKGIAESIRLRNILANQLRELSFVGRVFDSQANFLLVEFNDVHAIYSLLMKNGIVVRSMQQYPALQSCLRISIGTESENTKLINALTKAFWT